jgi:DHA2 family multidrug resistance protein
MFAGATIGFTLASIGCAGSQDFAALIALRTVQGFFGGALIPGVFTAVFELFARRVHPLATVIAGTVAMIAPTVGPALGGYLTETYTWHAIFLINVVPGLAVGSLVALCIRAGAPDFRALRHVDYITIVLAVAFLASLELLLKEAPKRHWHGAFVGGLAILCLLSFVVAIQQCLARSAPFVNLRRFRDRGFAVACFLSFILGLGLYGATYLLPLFLGFVRKHTALEIGETMIVAGAVQIVCAPIAAWLELRTSGKLLIAIGYVLFGAGLLADAFCTIRTDFADLILPQALRGAGIMFCILPSTRLALEGWPDIGLPDASALFNLMRNLGGAIGIALVDTVAEQRTPTHVTHIINRLQAGDPVTAESVGLPVAMFHGHSLGPVSEGVKQMVAPLVNRAALTTSFNEAWLLLGAIFLLSLPAIALLSRRAFSAVAYSARNE